MNLQRLTMSFTATDDNACIDGLVRSNVAGSWPPDQILGDDKPWKGQKSVDALLRCRRSFGLEWQPDSRDESTIHWERIFNFSGPTDRSCIKTTNRRLTADIGLARSLLQSLSFLICSAGSASKEWDATGSSLNYIGPGLGDLHFELGWMCAFKGDGHKQLVSRRWLDFGPWRVIRCNNDLTIVQFHELDTDDETALEQAKPGHQRLSPEGFIESDFPWRHLVKAPQSEGAIATIKGLYDPKTRTLMQVVTGRDVSQEEMTEACAIRLWQPLAEPVERIAYKFIREEDARRHLHELWLREIEVYTFIGGVERRIDEDYCPPKPIAPDWVKRVQDREGY